MIYNYCLFTSKLIRSIGANSFAKQKKEMSNKILFNLIVTIECYDIAILVSYKMWCSIICVLSFSLFRFFITNFRISGNKNPH